MSEVCGHEWPSKRHGEHVCLDDDGHGGRCECWCGASDQRLLGLAAIAGPGFQGLARGLIPPHWLPGYQAPAAADPVVWQWPPDPALASLKLGFAAPPGVTFAAGAITKDDWEAGFRRSSGALQPLDDYRPLLRGIDDLREERDQ